MSLARIAAASLFLLAGSAQAQESYPFTGEWDCGGTPFVFTATVYSIGEDSHDVQEVQEGSDGSYTLFLSDVVYVTLSEITADTLDFSSSESSRPVSCRRY